LKVSVVIPTYNRRRSLERCLASLATQTFPGEEFEIVVIADGCVDDTEDFLRAYAPPHRFTWLHQANQGPAAAQNAGIAMARGDIVVLLDDDCICETALIAAHYDSHRGGEQLVLIGPVRLHPDSPTGTLKDLKERAETAEFVRLSSGDIRRSDLMLCANSSIRREAAIACPFDPGYKRMHDVEAGLRLWERGYRPKFCANAIAYELFTKSVAGVLSDSRYQGQYEMRLTERSPRFKPLASVRRINEGNPSKRWLRKEMAVHAHASEFLLRLAYCIAEPVRRLAPFRRLANRTLRARLGVQHLRGAIEAAGSWKELERRFGKRTPVILYHNVGSPHPGEYPGLTIPPAEFESQICLLKRMGHQAILPSDWLRWRDEGADLPERPVMLVFDDGYDEACRVAFPILERHGFCAACMMVTGCVGSTNMWDEQAGRPTLKLMSQDQIVEWSQKRIEFGGHTTDHGELPLKSEQRVEYEIAQCKADLAKLLGHAPASFAYPFGAFNSVAENAVGRHFQLGFISWPGRLHLATNPRLIPRIAFLPGESRFGMWCRLRLGRNPFEMLRNRWRRLVRRNSAAAA
jgi:glycosyltransferase involved in cell wall biosynthesis/peptidoglycan/xylan/chitin deacetylase (PgdA/CDA1 family)